MAHSDDQRSSVPALTGLRIIAALAVVLFHLREDPLPALLPGVARGMGAAVYGGLGVDVFFTLSGFVLSWTYLRTLGRPTRSSVGRFLVLRLARLYPVHLISLGAMVVIVLATPEVTTTVDGTAIYGGGALVANILLVQAWGTSVFTWNYPAWSISSEWFAYLAFPLLALLLRRFGPLRAAGARIGLLACVLGGTLSLAASAGSGFEPLVRVSVEFSIGCLLFVLHCHTSTDDAAATGAWLWALIGADVVLTALIEGNLYTLAPALGLLVWPVARSAGPLARFLSAPTFVRSGEASYALYMTHVVVITALGHSLPGPIVMAEPLSVRVAVLAGYLSALVVVTLVVHRYVETPARRWVRDRMSGGKKRPQTSF